MTVPRTILAAFAHPDDEVFGQGGTLARYAAEGVSVTLVCATRGEVGEISDPALATPETLPQVREAELRCACRALGISDPILLGYRDSGMAGTADNDHPQAFCNIEAGEVVPRLVGLIRRLRPQVVLTFDPDGGYGHPDHVAIHRHTVAAFQAAPDPARYPDQGPPWQPARLFYSTPPRSLFLEIKERLIAHGVDPRELERLEEDARGWPDDLINASLDISPQIEVKWAAFACHRTQFGEDNLFRRIPEPDLKQLLSREHFALAWPEPAPGLRLPDLFAGL
ncbi:MAG: PIG-L family deacetylase [Anaerolineae bacterium]